MIRLKCPWCGERNMVEFTHGGDASHQYPQLADTTSETAYFDYVYLRDNPRGPSPEYWHHVYGCRQWFKVVRDTVTHEILETGTVADPFLQGGQ